MPRKSRRRREIRYRLREPLAVRVLLRSLRRASTRGVEALLVDVSKRGIGILVQEHVALETRCYVEIPLGNRIHRFKGEVCYGQRSNDGIRLGIMLVPDSPVSVFDFLQEHGVEFVQGKPTTTVNPS